MNQEEESNDARRLCRFMVLPRLLQVLTGAVCGRAGDN